MRAEPLKPWGCSRQKKLLRAAFHVDESRARSLADKWLRRHTIDDVTYPEHRVLVRLLLRFPDRFQDRADFPRLSGLRRQMWMRGNLNLKTSHPLLSALSDRNISWVLSGSAQWFVREAFPHREEADRVDFSIRPSARPEVEAMALQNGWRREWVAPNLETADVFSTYSKGSAGRIRICNAEKIFAGFLNRDRLIDRLWAKKKEIHHAIGPFFLPDSASLFARVIASSRIAHIPMDQWVFDFFNLALLHPEAVDFSASPAPTHYAWRLARFLNAELGVSSLES